MDLAIVPVMNQEQVLALNDVMSGKNVFITGGAGVGKSFLVHEIVKSCFKNKKIIGVCGMTGCAALIINGMTIHSFLGIGLAKESALKLAEKVRKFPAALSRILETDILLIDEVSMLNSELFEKINQFLQIVRRKKIPFGGVQMVLVGDPFQLCPVEGDYFFTSVDYTNFTVHNLSMNMRQRGDPEFKNLLDRVRWGGCSEEDLITLKKLQHTKFPDGIIPTKLYSKNISVDAINIAELNKLKTPQHDYEARANHEIAKKWMVANKIPDKIRLCIGAQVMCTKNITELGLANGSRGVITDLAPNHVSMRLLSGETVKVPFVSVPFQMETIKLQYMPFKLAWAVTIHSAQGMTIDALEVDLGKDIFTWGQAYTGLSRATSLSSVKVTSVLGTSFVTNPKVLNFISSIQYDNNSQSA